MISTIFQLTLLQVPGIGRKTALLALRASLPEHPAETLESLLALLETIKTTYPRVRVPSLTQLATAREDADKIWRNSERLGIRISGFHEPDFPECLRQIPDPPMVLHVKGNLACLNTGLKIAIVGTREPSEFGLTQAERWGGLAASRSAAVVSGLAHGCDTAGQRGCLDQGGVAIGVLAHGLDMIYPAASRQLGEQILAGHGALVSEYPAGTPPGRNLFVDRDRLQSGLSAGVIIIETGLTGGTMHTARFAREQGRKLAALAHPAELAASDKSQGNQRLIRDGDVTALKSDEDVFRFIDGLQGNPAARPVEKPAPPRRPIQRRLF